MAPTTGQGDVSSSEALHFALLPDLTDVVAKIVSATPTSQLVHAPLQRVIMARTDSSTALQPLHIAAAVVVLCESCSFAASVINRSPRLGGSTTTGAPIFTRL